MPPAPMLAKRRKQIRAALEGLTPYEVDDLVFDWWGNGPEVQVAVVARETLAEAEAFAAEHRFNPVSFVVGPRRRPYGGEPFFGPSALAATSAGRGRKGRARSRNRLPLSPVNSKRPKPLARPQRRSLRPLRSSCQPPRPRHRLPHRCPKVRARRKFCRPIQHPTQRLSSSRPRHRPRSRLRVPSRWCPHHSRTAPCRTSAQPVLRRPGLPRLIPLPWRWIWLTRRRWRWT